MTKTLAPMKMKELERVSGLGRETIRYYIREGLLPEPERPKRNVALYSGEHVERLQTIKRLQAERHLPLHLIKTLVLAEAQNPQKGFEAFIGLDRHLAPLLSEQPAPAGRNDADRYLLKDVVERIKLSDQDVKALLDMGFVTVDREDNEDWLNARNVRLLEIIAAWRAAGFNEAAGFEIENYRIYVEVADALAHRSVAQFYNIFGDKMTGEGAAQLAALGIKLANEMMPLLRIEKIIREVQRVNAKGNSDTDE